jgi:hypothetical protein
MSIIQSHMPNSNRPRLSISPEKLILAKIVYSVESDCARTFFIVGDCVVWSHHPHLQIISCFRTMENARDRKTAKLYGVHISGKLTQADFECFRKSLTGVLGDNRRTNKAGRLWKNIPDDDGSRISVISFWAYQPTINDHDIALLQKTFRLKTPLWVDFVKEKFSTLYLPQS